MKHRDKILELRSQGKSYNQISLLLGCAKSTISFHCNQNDRKRRLNKSKEYKENRHPLYKKIERFVETSSNKQSPRTISSTISKRITNKLHSFYSRTINVTSQKVTFQELIEIIGDNPTCYLTGLPIDINKPETYELDHKIPRSRCGDNSIDNLGLCIKQANQAKRDMTPDEFINLCKQVLTHNGYQINKAEEKGDAPLVPDLTDTHD